MLRKKNHLILGFLACILFILYQSATIVPEGQTGLLLSEEKLLPYSDSILKPGLHFIIPFLMRPILLDNRLQTVVFSETSAEDNSPKKSITKEYFANWHISDPVRYYQQTKNNFQQIKLLISQQITTLFNDKKTPIPFSQLILNGSPQQIDSVLSVVNKQLKTVGIKLTTIGFKQLDLSADANARILDNMSIEQENTAIAQRAQGKANAELIRANADSSASLILAKAKEQAAKIRAQGDAEAAKIYNQAYNKNPEFAAFYLNLEAYQQGLNPSSMNNFLLLTTKNEHFKLEKARINKNKFKLTN
ncbi:protease modulator HflC [Rickettsiella endosymbiont of Rhagonycha lignosa]|uniref:protease modulator HflC n=1 Tax=Rickettsiella endosymbiont of Rhagonycha lignosa TaxID=3077937 RepID=UPI00313C58F8